MNDYEEQLSGGTPPELTPQQRAELEAEQERIQTELELTQPEVEQPEVSQPAATAAPVEAPPQQQQTEEPLINGRPLSYYADPTGAEAMVAGVEDFVLDALNLVPGIEIPKAPEFENKINQSVREISSIVIPTVALGSFGSAALASRAGQVNKATKLGKFLNDPFTKHIGNMAFQAGAGAAVDYTVEINQEDDNLTGTLRKTWPRWWGWVPEDLATLDSDSPDTKRAKNVTEGAYLGVGTDIFISKLS
jgi:hypothetical protein